MKVVAILLLIVLTAAVPVAASVPTTQPRGAVEDFTDFSDPFEEPADRSPAVEDPLEPLNRAAFWANDKVYTYLLQPFCQRVPEEIRQTIADGIQWLTTPMRVGNVKLGFAFRDAGSELGRFAVHGLLGLLQQTNPTASASVAKEDFDGAFEGMGMTPGFYLILPVLGPSTLRDGVGRLASFYIDPPTALQAEGAPAGPEDSLSDEMKTYAAIRQTALDPYLFIRDAYHQQQVASRKDAGGKNLSARAFFSREGMRDGSSIHLARNPG